MKREIHSVQTNLACEYTRPLSLPRNERASEMINHSQKFPGNFGCKVNQTRLFRSFQWKLFSTMQTARTSKKVSQSECSKRKFAFPGFGDFIFRLINPNCGNFKRNYRQKFISPKFLFVKKIGFLTKMVKNPRHVLLYILACEQALVFGQAKRASRELCH